MAAESSVEVALHVRWMIRSDLRRMVAIERACYADPWTESDFVNLSRRTGHVSMVVEGDNLVLGYMVYRFEPNCIRLLNLAVDPGAHRLGIGRFLVEKLRTKLHPDRRVLSVLVRETNLPGQLFWRAMGAKCVLVVKEAFDDSDDGYEFELRHSAPAPGLPDTQPHVVSSRRGI